MAVVGGAGRVRLPAPPRPKGILGGREGVGSWRVKVGVVVVVVVDMVVVVGL